MSVAEKNPVFVDAGKRGALKRWGDHDAKYVKLDALTLPQRELVLALIRAAKDQAAKSADERAAPNANGTAQEVSSASSNTTAQT